LTKLERQSLGALGRGATIPPSRATTPRDPWNQSRGNLTAARAEDVRG
jgi:hypothetical protein